MNISMIILVIALSLLEGYRAGVKTNNKTFDFKAFLKSFLIVAVGITVIGSLMVILLDFITDKYIPKDSIWGF